MNLRKYSKKVKRKVLSILRLGKKKDDEKHLKQKRKRNFNSL